MIAYMLLSGMPPFLAPTDEGIKLKIKWAKVRWMDTRDRERERGDLFTGHERRELAARLNAPPSNSQYGRSIWPRNAHAFLVVSFELVGFHSLLSWV